MWKHSRSNWNPFKNNSAPSLPDKRARSSKTTAEGFGETGGRRFRTVEYRASAFQPSAFGLQPSSISVRNRHPPILPQGPLRDLDADRRLPALVFTAVHHPHDTRYRDAVEARFNDLFERPVLFHIGLENGIQNLIGRQRVFILLVGPQFSSRRPI